MDSFANLQLCGQRSNAKHLSNHWITHVRPQLRMDTQTRTHTHSRAQTQHLSRLSGPSLLDSDCCLQYEDAHTHIHTSYERGGCADILLHQMVMLLHTVALMDSFLFHGGQARDEGPHKPDYTKLQFSQNRFLENCRLLTLCNFSFSKSKTQEHKSKEGLKSGFICSDVSYNRIACLTFWLKES